MTEPLFNTTILKTNTKIKNSIKYTFEHDKTISRVTCFSSITQVCLFLWTKAPQVCSSYHRGTRLRNVDWCGANIVKTTDRNICLHLTPQKVFISTTMTPVPFFYWVVPCLLTFSLHLQALTHCFTSSQSTRFLQFKHLFLHYDWLGLASTKMP